ncbi:MAG: hypothetical protein Tsb0034_09180 [Ekhidna sp.]
MKIPQPSPKVVETQRLGITDITIDYSSPATRGRDVWNDIVRQSGDPNLAWRAGANMNTRISFSTDVTINGEPLEAGSYGFHIDPDGENYILMFAHHDNLWGSYYLNRDKHVAFKTTAKSVETNFSEQLDYEFVDRTDSTVVIALEWADKRIPFTVGVDLNKTVIENFRYELLGENTNRWQAWNDAASWCLNRNTNLEEALEWANRSINGGYGGFAANRNAQNVGTKIQILARLNKKDELPQALEQLKGLDMGEFDYYTLNRALNNAGLNKEAYDLIEEGIKTYPDVWYLKLSKGVTQYFMGDTKKAFQTFDKMNAPDNFSARLEQIKKEMNEGTYQYPN